MASTATDSRTLPDLVNKPGKSNWVEKAGGLPDLIKRVAKHLVSEEKYTESRAIATAANTVEKVCATGRTFGGKTEVSKKYRDACCAAAAEWKAKAGKSRLREAVAIKRDEDPEIPEDVFERMAESAGARLRLLEARSLPTTGPGARFDQLLVEATATRRPASSAARAEQRGKRDGHARDGEFETKHPRSRKGARTGGEFVKSGAAGAPVQAVQSAVGAKIDGAFGDLTKKAVMEYQRKHGLTVDGVVGHQTAAAIRGNKDAANVKVGTLSSADRHYLGTHGSRVAKREKRNGKTTTTATTRLREAVAIPSVLDHVKKLEPGEHAMLPDGHAVRHVHTQDARPIYQTGSPDRYSGSSSVISWGAKEHATPESAVAEALTNSAAHDNPASVGGDTRWTTWSDVLMPGGARASFRGVSATGQPLIRRPSDREPSQTSWWAIEKAPPRHSDL
jgi:hypothetical protein